MKNGPLGPFVLEVLKMFDCIKQHERHILFALRKVETPKERLCVLMYGLICLMLSMIIIAYTAFLVSDVNIAVRIVAGFLLAFLGHLVLHYGIRALAVYEVIKRGSYRIR